MRRRSFYLFVIATLLILSSATIGLAAAQGGGEIRAVDLLGAWTEAGAPNGDFNFTGADGNAYTANFEADVLPLFTTPSIWFEGSQACTECHYDNSEDSYHEMDLSSYEGIMAGGDVLSEPPGVPLLGQTTGGSDFDWEHSKLRSRLRDNRMPPGWEFDITEENRDGPTLIVGTSTAAEAAPAEAAPAEAAPAEAAPATLPQAGGSNAPLAWGLAAAGLVTLLAGLVLRRREQAG